MTRKHHGRCIRATKTINASPTDVWRAWADPEHIAQWFVDRAEGTAKPGMEQPIHYWVPSIAPSGMAFYAGDKFPRWRGNLFVGALRERMLVRLELDGAKVVKEERLLRNALGRIRDVRVGPDGFVYVLTDSSDGVLARLEPPP